MATRHVGRSHWGASMASTVLSATHNGNTSAETDGSPTANLPMPDGDVVFTLTSDTDLQSATLVHDDAGVSMTVDQTDRKIASHTVAITESNRGVYRAKAMTLDGTEIPLGNQVDIQPPAEAEADGDDDADTDDEVSEVSLGEYDGVFAYVTLGIVVAFCLGVGYLVWTLAGKVGLPAAGTTVPAQATLDGSFAQRLTLLVCLFGAAAGVIITLFGAWQAGLETRGRLRLGRRAPATEDVTTTDVRGPLADILESGAKLVDAARRLRGTVAVIISGAALAALAMWFASLTVTARPPETPPPTPSASALATPGPSAGASAGPPTTSALTELPHTTSAGR